MDHPRTADMLANHAKAPGLDDPQLRAKVSPHVPSRGFFYGAAFRCSASLQTATGFGFQRLTLQRSMRCNSWPTNIKTMRPSIEYDLIAS